MNPTRPATNTTVSNGTTFEVTVSDLDWYKPLGRGEKFRRQAHALARRMRIPWVRTVVWEKANPQAARNTGTYGPPWTSMNCLANFSFACTCHKRDRYSRKGKRKRVKP